MNIGGKQLEMLLASAVVQVCSTITAHMSEPPIEVQRALRDQIRVALIGAWIVGSVSKRGRYEPAQEIETTKEVEPPESE